MPGMPPALIHPTCMTMTTQVLAAIAASLCLATFQFILLPPPTPCWAQILCRHGKSVGQAGL